MTHNFLPYAFLQTFVSNYQCYLPMFKSPEMQVFYDSVNALMKMAGLSKETARQYNGLS